MGMYGYSMCSIILTTAHLHRTAAAGGNTVSGQPLRTPPWRLFAPRPGAREGGAGGFTHSGVMYRLFSTPISSATEPDW